MSGRVYLDYNATSPVGPQVMDAIAQGLLLWGNPSSIHREGRRARAAIERARSSVARAIGADAGEVVFTSGGTEADWMGIVGLAIACDAKRVLTTRIEHPAVDSAAAFLGRERQMATHYLAIDHGGVVDGDRFRKDLARGDVVAVSLVNHELGTVQDVAALADCAREAGVLVHCDAVQAVGKLVVDVHALGADTVALSAHKFGGPKGVGALWVRGGLELGTVWLAGHQERGRRPGTENTPGIVGAGAAAELVGARTARSDEVSRLAASLEDGLSAVDGATVRGTARVGNTVCVTFTGVVGEVVVQALDLAGIAASTGAACSSGTVAPSKVLLGLGLGEDVARSAVRFSLGPENTADDIDKVLAVIPEIIARARQFS